MKNVVSPMTDLPKFDDLIYHSIGKKASKMKEFFQNNSVKGL